jgi:hypothetical protein
MCYYLAQESSVKSNFEVLKYSFLCEASVSLPENSQPLSEVESHTFLSSLPCDDVIFKVGAGEDERDDAIGEGGIGDGSAAGGGDSAMAR